MDAADDQDDQHATRVPPADGADVAWRHELARLDQLRVVSQAHDIVADAEHADLADALAAARRHLVQAQQRLIQARAMAMPRPSPRRRQPWRRPTAGWRA